MKKRKFYLGILIIFIFLVGIYFILLWGLPISPIDFSDYPKKGESFRAIVDSVIEKGRYRYHINNVQVTLTDIITGVSQTNTTQQNGLTSFEVITGNTYDFVATFHNSTKSITCTIGPTDEGWIRGVYILISENNTIDSIECQPVWFE